MELLTKLGIDWRLLLAQIINFLILLFILYKVLYKPVLKMLHDRTSRIEKSLVEARHIEKNLRAAEQERLSLVASARKQTQEIIEEAVQEAEKRKRVTVEEAKREAKKIVEDGRKQLDVHKETLVREVRAELTDLVIESSQRVLSDVMDKELEQKLATKTIEKIGRAPLEVQRGAR